MVIWGFAIRKQMAADIHFLYPLMFLILFVIHCVLAYRFMKRSGFIHGFQPLSILIFIVLDMYLLVSVSTIKRENEIRNYFATNEMSLYNIVDHFQSYGDDNKVNEMKREMNIERVRNDDEMFGYENKSPVLMTNVRLYTCVGYAYGFIYACNESIGMPKNLRGSPVTNWLKLKDHWYYYSIFD
jgi:hypothetical protein